MKTSLIIDDQTFKEAQKEAKATGKTLSEIISLWSRLGRHTYRELERQNKPLFQAVDLGKALIELSNRKNWMEELE